MKQYRLAYWLFPYYRSARKALRKVAFDVVLANDLTAAGVAAAVAPQEKILLDLHEYWLGIHDNVPAWRKLRIPYHDWLLRTYAASMASHTTVSDSIASRYREEYGFSCRVVNNASVYCDLTPQPVREPLRLVHSGIAKPARRIESMMRAAASSRSHVTLDLFLTGTSSPYYQELQNLAGELGDKVRILPPVPHQGLIERLNQYDVGVAFLPPTTTNIRLCLPNKFFDFVQARLAIVTGPTEAMQTLVDDNGLGVVSDGFEPEDLARAIDELTSEDVLTYKQNAHAAARKLSGEQQIAVWRQEIEAVLRKTTTH